MPRKFLCRYCPRVVDALQVCLLAAGGEEPQRSFWEALAIGAGGGLVGGLATMTGAILTFRGTKATIKNTKTIADRVDATTRQLAERSDVTTRDLAQLADARAASASNREMIRAALEYGQKGYPGGEQMLQALARTDLSASDRLLVEAAIAVIGVTRPVIESPLTEARALEEATGEPVRFYVQPAPPSGPDPAAGRKEN